MTNEENNFAVATHGELVVFCPQCNDSLPVKRETYGAYCGPCSRCGPNAGFAIVGGGGGGGGSGKVPEGGYVLKDPGSVTASGRSGWIAG